MLTFSPNAQRLLAARYLGRDDDDRVAETPAGMLGRVAAAVSAGEAGLPGGSPAAAKALFLDLLESGDFLPNSPTLMNAGRRPGQLSACFVLPLVDDLGSIFDTVKLAALVQQGGGGTGFDFTPLRPAGDRVRSTGGAAAGPLDFMEILDTVTARIRQGGRRRGANMAVLAVDHPDIEAFIACKRAGGRMRNFNLSVAVTDEFMTAAARGAGFALRHPADGRRVREVDAGALLMAIAEAAWRSGDPGLIFIDAVNRANPTPHLGRLTATNPCGEMPLLPYEACNLGSLNLARFTRAAAGGGRELDGERLAERAGAAVRFLDDVVSAGQWPAAQIRTATLATRKIGLGVMGFAELLLQLGIPYASAKAEALGDRVMGLISASAHAASERLASARGVYPAAGPAGGAPARRNATCTSVAPTGTISILAGTSSGIEPLFALAQRRQADLEGEPLIETNRTFEEIAGARGCWTAEVEAHVLKFGSVAGLSGLPADLLELGQTAPEIGADWHLRIQAAFQRHTDSGVSKTINLPAKATVEDVAAVFRRAHALALKGVTVFRPGAAAGAVLTPGLGGEPAGGSCRPHGCDPAESG